ncbi:sodium-independent sulfate anion transporter-like isoform X2 [Hylaeus volcanicus]|uniref:sodium-independent sulfate anion transporter-like isoform X2 n=1 Tax=Hylaeus volcanicus TaxID=313075 RepID=UPI0023B7A04A|nr:sodium-independent sulfate anion transporter-like isoform X2 [Hylaeus volcanicus]
MKITLMDPTPIVYQPYRVLQSEQRQISEIIEGLKEADIIEDSESSFVGQEKNRRLTQSPEQNLLCSFGKRWLYQRIKRSCRKKLLYKRLPIVAWLRMYRRDYIASDLVAGITVGLTIIPQAIAYANVAGLPLQKMKDLRIMQKATKVPSKGQVIVQKSLWLLSTSRNILVVLVCAVMSWLLESHLGSSPVKLTGHVKQGLPEFQPPPFQTYHKNETYHFVDMVSALGSGCLVIPLLSLLETISIAKVFNEGKPIDATQEMLALGACNVLSAFVSSMPVSGGLSRGAVNHSSGVKTTLGGIYTGLLVLISLQFLTPYLYFIPNAALAAIIIAAVIFMVELHVIKPIWRTKKIDLIPAVATFLCCLFIRLELGIVIGIGINVLFLLYASARPSLRVHKDTSINGCEYLVITPDRSLVFPSVEYVRAVISKQGTRQGIAVPVVIDSTHIQAADFTAAKGVKNLTEDFSKRGQPLIFHNLKPSVIEIFKGVKPSGLRCSSNELELDDCLKEFSNILTTTTNRY